MKKKLEKELNKITPDGVKITKILDSHNFNRIGNYGNSNYLQVDFKLKKKKQNPEWIRITEKGTRSVPDGMLFKVKSWGSDGYPFIKDLDGDELSVNLSKWELATPAEIEAHKLGFHVGDEVYNSDGNKFIIRDFDLGGLTGEVIAYFKAGFDYTIYNYLSQITKTPPKQPILQIDGKDYYKDEEYWSIGLNENWKLFHVKIKSRNEGTVLKSDEYWQYFTTKQQALEYVLEEAKRMFEGCEKIKYSDEKHSHNFNPDELRFNKYGQITYENFCVWIDTDGWLAEPIKEPKLMLGEWSVEIEKIILSKETEAIKERYDIIIKAKDGQVTRKEWLEFYNTYSKAKKLKLSKYTIPIRKYNAIFYAYEHSYYCEIGCIKNVTFDQIEAITKALNEC